MGGGLLANSLAFSQSQTSRPLTLGLFMCMELRLRVYLVSYITTRVILENVWRYGIYRKAVLWIFGGSGLTDGQN